MQNFIQSYPWRESLLIFLLLWLNMGMSYMIVKKNYVPIVSSLGRYRLIRFLFIFITSYLTFSIDLDDGYEKYMKILAALVIAFVFDLFIENKIENKEIISN